MYVRIGEALLETGVLTLHWPTGIPSAGGHRGVAPSPGAESGVGGAGGPAFSASAQTGRTFPLDLESDLVSDLAAHWSPGGAWTHLQETLTRPSSESDWSAMRREQRSENRGLSPGAPDSSSILSLRRRRDVEVRAPGRPAGEAVLSTQTLFGDDGAFHERELRDKV